MYSNSINRQIGQKLTNQTFIINPQLRDMNQTEVTYRSKVEIKSSGIAFWNWYYTDSSVPNCNLITVGTDGKIQTTNILTFSKMYILVFIVI